MGVNTPARTGANTGARVGHIVIQTRWSGMDIQTVHLNEDGVQHTYRVVIIDSGGWSYPHTFEVVDGEHEYRGAGEPGDIEERDEPPATAVEQLEREFPA